MNTQAMDIPVDVEVKCCDRNCGRSTYIVLNPVTKEITHLVVKQREFPHTERLVPIDLMVESTPRLIRLRCDAPDLDRMDEFFETQFIPSKRTHIVDGAYLMWPYTYTTQEYVSRDQERIPIDELAIPRGAHVEAEDGRVGRVDEFIVDRESEHITHLVMREGHLWGQRDVTIPVSYIKRIDDDSVYLTIDKASVEALPVVPVFRE